MWAGTHRSPLGFRATQPKLGGKEIGASVRTVHVRHLGAVFGYVDREPSQNELEELVELMDLAFPSPDAPP